MTPGMHEEDILRRHEGVTGLPGEAHSYAFQSASARRPGVLKQYGDRPAHPGMEPDEYEDIAILGYN